VVTHGRAVDRNQVDFDGPTPAPACRVEAGMDGQAVEPGIETVRFSQSGQVSPGSEERLLHDVSDQLAIAEDESGRSVEPWRGALDEHRKGVVIASLCPFD
jgi:hypothetical protein